MSGPVTDVVYGKLLNSKTNWLVKVKFDGWICFTSYHRLEYWRDWTCNKIRKLFVSPPSSQTFSCRAFVFLWRSISLVDLHTLGWAETEILDPNLCCLVVWFKLLFQLFSRNSNLHSSTGFHLWHPKFSETRSSSVGLRFQNRTRVLNNVIAPRRNSDFDFVGPLHF